MFIQFALSPRVFYLAMVSPRGQSASIANPLGLQELDEPDCPFGVL